MPYDSTCCVAEIHGVDGPVSFPELLMQKIWASGDFARDRLVTIEGERVEILGAGRWNRLAGPDFQGARLRIGGRETRGDIELHLRAEDWAAHGHALDPAFDRVVLHVVLFPPPRGYACLGGGGSVLPTLVLLPLLPRDLESYALDDAAERLANRSLFHAREELGLLDREALLAELRRWADKRWQAKRFFARLKLARMSWAEACHFAALECLGFRFNRAAMAAVAERWPLEAWQSGRAQAVQVWEETREQWRAPWGRPSNHPLHRLRSYERWVAGVPDWPDRLWAMAGGLEPVESCAEVGLERRRLKLSDQRRMMCDVLTWGVLPGTRFDTLVCDQLFPLLAARGNLDTAWQKRWFVWYAGDLPEHHGKCLQELGVTDGRLQPLCNGWSQGLLGWCIDRETRSLLGEDETRSDS